MLFNLYKYSYSDKFISYWDARTWAQGKKIKSKEQWRVTPRPNYIPYHPEEVYPEWVSWKDFLGKFVTYEQAQEWAKQKGIKSQVQWFKTPKPFNIPDNPEKIYIFEWKNWDTFLGLVQPITWATYQQASEWAQNNNIFSEREWDRKGYLRPANIPPHPEKIYPEWVSWPAFLKRNYVFEAQEKNKTPKLRNYRLVKEWALNNGFTNKEQWFNTQKPDFIPNNVAALLGFRNWESFFTPDKVVQQNISTPIPYNEVKKKEQKVTSLREIQKWMRQQGISTLEEYQALDKPHDFPDNPETYYPNFWPTNMKQSNNFNLAKYAQNKVLYIMRGFPGSGKSTLAAQLGKGGVVYSTDDFFMQNGNYVFDPKMLGKNHASNYSRTIEAMKQGISPIVVDNTNTQAFEMKNYVKAGQQYGYKVEFREPQTEWAWNADELAKRNTHGVPKDKIEQMINRYDPNTDLDYITNSKAPWEK